MKNNLLRTEITKSAISKKVTNITFMKISQLIFKMVNSADLKVFILFILVFGLTLQSSAQSWYDGSWSFRKSHIITGSAGAGTNYQMRIIANKATGTDSGANIYLGTNVRDDFGDVRFTASDGTTLLDYWLETGSLNSGSQAAFWVEVAADLGSNQTIYIYYGNSSATTSSNGTNTFTLFDDFTGTSLNTSLWTQRNGGTPSFSGGLMTVSANATDPSKIIATGGTTNDNLAIVARFKVTGGTNDDERVGVGVHTENSTTPRGYNYVLHDLTNLDEVSFLNDATAWYTLTGSWTKNTNYIMEVFFTGANARGRLNYGTWNSQAMSGRTGYAALNIGSFDATSVWDWAFIRKCITIEPSHGIYGAEQSLIPVATNATNQTTTSFSANWNAAASATGYYLDVATNAAFTSFVTGYNNKDVGNVTTSSVTGLTPGSIYYYRLRAYGSYGTGGNSNTITVVTGGGTNNFISNVTTGNWGTPSSWLYWNGSAWITPGLPPSSGSGTITILSGHTITVAANVTVDQVTVAAGGQVTIASNTLTIANGTGNDLEVSGILRYNGGTITINANANIVINDGGRYQHGFTTIAGTIPTATWNTGSTCEIVGYTNPGNGTTPGGLGQTFSNFTWNCASQASRCIAWGTSMVVNGNYTVQNTNTNLIYFADGTNVTASIIGNYIQSGGQMRFTRGNGNAIVNITGNLELLSGTLNIDGGNGGSILNLNGNTTLSGGILTESGSGSAAFNFAKSGTQTYVKTAGTISNTINFTVNSGSILDMGTSILNGSTGTFSLSSGAGIITANTAGLSLTGATGSVQVTGTRAFDSGADYTYNGSVDQVTGTALTGARNLTINTSGPAIKVTSSTQTFTVSNNLTVSQGNLILSATNADYTITNDLIVSSSGKFTHSVNWDSTGKLLSIGGNILIDGIFDYTVRSHVQMISSGIKTVRTGSNAASAFSILTLLNGTFSANGPLKVNDNFWAMFGSAGSFHTNGQIVTALSALLNNNGTVYIDGGTLNVTGGITVGAGTNGNVIFSSGTLNTDIINVGNGAQTGTFAQTGGTTNLSGSLLIYPSCSYICTNSPIINIGGNWTNNGIYTKASETVTFSGTAVQSIGGSGANTFSNLIFSGSGTKNLTAAVNVSNNLSIASGAIANLGTGITSSANTMTLGGVGVINGSWGSSSSTATYKNNIYFAAATGIINVGVSSAIAGTWFGTTSTDWNTGSNWSGGAKPTSSTDIIIMNVTNDPVISSTATADCKNIELQTGATLTIQSDGMNSGSLIVAGTSSGTGTVTYNRYMASNRWYIASAPVSVASGFIGTNIKQNGSVDYDFAVFDEPNNEWDYQTSIPSTLTPGQGYITRLTGTNLQFTGSLNNGNVPISVTGTGDNYGWNAVGNPYTSAIGITSSASSAQNFLAVNGAKLDPDYGAIYVWNQDGAYDGSQDFYKVISNSGYSSPDGYSSISANYVQAGQGFLVNVSDNATLSFTRNMQYHSPTETLKSAEISWPGITLKAENDGNTRTTVVAFNSNMTEGIDKTYDAGLFSASDFNVYTHLANNMSQTDLAIQCLPEGDWDKLSVPIGLDLPDGGEVTFKATGVILPDGLFPVIEDRQLKRRISLKSETDSYKVTLNGEVEGTGRFYLHIGGVIMPEDPEELINTRYSARYDNDRITIFGNVAEPTKAILYDLMGRKLGEYPLLQDNYNDIPAVGLTQRVYLLKLEGKDYRQVIKVPVAK
jgi:hypothetical protein